MKQKENIKMMISLFFLVWQLHFCFNAEIIMNSLRRASADNLPNFLSEQWKRREKSFGFAGSESVDGRIKQRIPYMIARLRGSSHH